MSVRFAVLLAVVSACTGAHSTGIEPLSCPPEGTTLTYANFGEEAIANHCATAGCHASRSPKLTTQTAIQQHADEILDEGVYTDAMPEDRDMSLDDRRRLGEWLACGAP